MSRYIRAPLSQLEIKCNKRGYLVEHAKACLVRVFDDGTALYDIEHPAYPRERDETIKIELNGYGPGSQLKKILSKVGITATPNCSCNARAAMMDTQGIEWCEENIDMLVDFLRTEAAKRKLPFIDAAGRALVKMAIKRAKKNIDK